MDLNMLELKTVSELKQFKKDHNLSQENTKPDEDHPCGYSSMSLKCECAGEFRPRGLGLKYNGKEVSKKCGCPFIIYLISDKDKTKLIVDNGPNKKYRKKTRTSCFRHNEQCIDYHKKKSASVSKPNIATTVTGRCSKMDKKPSINKSAREKNTSPEQSVSNVILKSAEEFRTDHLVNEKSTPDVKCSGRTDRQSVYTDELQVEDDFDDALKNAIMDYDNKYIDENSDSQTKSVINASTSERQFVDSQDTSSSSLKLRDNSQSQKNSLIRHEGKIVTVDSMFDEEIDLSLEELFLQIDKEAESDSNLKENCESESCAKSMASPIKGKANVTSVLKEASNKASKNLLDSETIINDTSNFASSKTASLKSNLCAEDILLKENDTRKQVVEEELIIANPEIKSRGRPKNTKKLTPSGLQIVPTLSDYTTKDPKIQAKFVLKLMLKDEAIYKNIVEGCYSINVDDFKKITEGNLPDIFLDDNFDEKLLSNLDIFWKDDAKKINQFIKTLIKKKKREQKFTCPTCSKQASDDLAQCNSCLAWYHLETCVPTHQMSLPRQRNKSWYCDTCIQLSKK